MFPKGERRPFDRSPRLTHYSSQLSVNWINEHIRIIRRYGVLLSMKFVHTEEKARAVDIWFKSIPKHFLSLNSGLSSSIYNMLKFMFQRHEIVVIS